MFGTLFENVRRKAPLIHCITNYVTVNDCANMLLACGASPVMADDCEEAAEIAGICQGLVVNIGTLNTRIIPAMTAAGRRANELGHPVVLDPVGAGASRLRTETALLLMEEIRFAVIRGNMSEIRSLAGAGAATRGVDVNLADRVTEENLAKAVAFAMEFAQTSGAVAVITGAVDIVADKDKAYCIRNGHPVMSAVTGTGCQLSALTGAFAAANPDLPLESAAAAVCAMGLCGETGYKRMGDMDGNASCRNYIIDAMYRLTPRQLEEGADCTLWDGEVRRP